MLAAKLVPERLQLPGDIRSAREHPLLYSHKLVACAQMAEHPEGTERQRSTVACIHSVAAHQIWQLYNLHSAAGTPPSACGALPAEKCFVPAWSLTRSCTNFSS